MPKPQPVRAACLGAQTPARKRITLRPPACVVLRQLADVIDCLDVLVGMDCLEQVILKQVAWRKLGELGIKCDLHRVQHALGKDSVAKGRVALAATEEGQPKLTIRCKTLGLPEHEVSDAGRAADRRSRRVFPTSVLDRHRAFQERLDLARSDAIVQLKLDLAAPQVVLLQFAKRRSDPLAMFSRKPGERGGPVMRYGQPADVPSRSQIARQPCCRYGAMQRLPRSSCRHCCFEQNNLPRQAVQRGDQSGAGAGSGEQGACGCSSLPAPCSPLLTSHNSVAPDGHSLHGSAPREASGRRGASTSGRAASQRPFSSTTAAQKRCRGAKCSSHWATISAFANGDVQSLRSQRSSQAVAAVRSSASDVRNLN